MKPTKLSKDFTSGSISKQLFALMIPFMLSNALQVLYSTIDMIIVGKYVGTAGLSAVSQSSQILNFATMVCLGFANGGQVLIAQAIGAGKKKETNSIIGTLFTIILSMGLLFSLIILIAKNVIIKVMNIPPESVAMSNDYLIICGLGMIFTAGYNMVSAILRGMGDSKRPLLFIAIASVVNLLLDILFTGMWGWGVAGAAWATIIGQAVSFFFSHKLIWNKLLTSKSREQFEKMAMNALHKYVAQMIKYKRPDLVMDAEFEIGLHFLTYGLGGLFLEYANREDVTEEQFTKQICRLLNR